MVNDANTRCGAALPKSKLTAESWLCWIRPSLLANALQCKIEVLAPKA